MSIYNVLSVDIPIVAYSVLHQHKSTVVTKEYVKSLHGLRDKLKGETDRIKLAWESHIADMTAKTVQTTRGNLSQFLSTPLQSDTSEIQRIIKDQVIQTSEQLLPNIVYGLIGGYDARYLMEAQHRDIPKSRMAEGRSFLQKTGFKVGRINSTVFESLYLVQGGLNLDILDYMNNNGIGINKLAQEKKVDEFAMTACSLQNLLFLDGTIEHDTDRFELHVNFVKGKAPYGIFDKELAESMKYFRTEIHSLNVTVWQRKLGLGIGEEYTLRIRTKDRTTLRSAISIAQKYTKDKNQVASSIGAGVWFVKEIV
jgi:hypothetical protein